MNSQVQASSLTILGYQPSQQLGNFTNSFPSKKGLSEVLWLNTPNDSITGRKQRQIPECCQNAAAQLEG